MKGKILSIILLVGILAVSGCATNPEIPGQDSKTNTSATAYAGKKILVIDSYNAGSDTFELKMKGIQGVLNNTGIELRTVHMDEKNHPDEEFQKQAALSVKSAIESFKPDVIISLDDPAFKYVIMPYYKDSSIPVVFGGVNWDSSVYGAPYSNTAGMEEVARIDQLFGYLSEYSKGNRIGLLAGNTSTDNINARYYEIVFNISFAKSYHINTFEEWKQAFMDIQNEADYALIENVNSIKNWNDTEAGAFVQENTRIPAGAILDYVTNYTLIGLTKITEEQGEWPAQTALKILDGAKPSDIPIVQNKKGKLVVNLKLASKLNIIIRPDLLKNAEIIR